MVIAGLLSTGGGCFEMVAQKFPRIREGGALIARFITRDTHSNNHMGYRDRVE
jgi:hypothetical protein